MFDDLDWSLSASRGFVSISWASCFISIRQQLKSSASFLYSANWYQQCPWPTLTTVNVDNDARQFRLINNSSTLRLIRQLSFRNCPRNRWLSTVDNDDDRSLINTSIRVPIPNSKRAVADPGCPLPTGVGSGEGPPQKKMKFSSWNAHFSVFGATILLMQIPCITACNERENRPQSVYDIRLTFLPRDAMRKRGLWCRPVSVRPSVTLVYCIHTAEDIVKLLSPPGSPITLVFDPRRRYPIPRGKPFSRGAKYTRVGKICDRNRRLNLGNGTISPWLLLNAYRKWYALYRMVTFPMTLTDP